MSYQFYLKKVVAFIEAKGYEGEFERLGKKLEQMGIGMDYYSRSPEGELGNGMGEERYGKKRVGEERLGEEKAVEEGDGEEKFRQKKCMEKNEKDMRKEGGVLWIVDNGKLAESFSLAHIPILVFMHPGNREQDFFRVQYGMEHPEEMDAEYLDKIYRRFAGKPWDIMETERCLVRETIPDDVDAFYKIYSDPSITEHMDGLYPDPEQEREYIREYQEKVYSFYEFGIWTVLWKETGEVIGRAGVNYREGYDDPELGFIIGVPWQGRGLATEVCKKILEYGWEELEFMRVQALVEPDNAKSLAVCGKLGMQVLDRVEENGKEFIRLAVDYE